eukprot:TRINITY_DN1316_c0_g1_i1.p1 TRINITY_DN1316_c0_g1~~TRINITY_DN1316_c0_g1_i1.p1  ORF type:complete len:146 (+),score=27.71 TRINITY_DN1316_c0_g1_i1:95-532(+)
MIRRPPRSTHCISSAASDVYKRQILASLEFISRLYGIHLTQDRIYWSCLNNGHDYDYSQEWGNLLFRMTTKGNQVFCSINGKEVFSFTKGIRVVSDLEGKILEVVGIEIKDRKATIIYKGRNLVLFVAPNTISSWKGKYKKFEEL